MVSLGSFADAEPERADVSKCSERWKRWTAELRAATARSISLAVTLGDFSETYVPWGSLRSHVRVRTLELSSAVRMVIVMDLALMALPSF